LSINCLKKGDKICLIIEGRYTLIEKCLYNTYKRVTVSVWFGSKFDFYNRKLLKSFYTCFQNQIIHKHVHMDYNPLKGMLVLISLLKKSIVPYAAGSESHSRTAYMAIYRCQTTSQVSLFVRFLISWIY